MIEIKAFLGESPRSAPELLPPNAAQSARNCTLGSGDIIPLNNLTYVATPSKVGVNKSIYLFANQYWFHWLDDVNAAQTSVGGISHRTVITGDGEPKITDNSIAVQGGTHYPVAAYKLGIPAPTSAPIVSAVIQSVTLTIQNPAQWAGPGNEIVVDTMTIDGNYMSVFNLADGDYLTINSITSGFLSLVGQTFEIGIRDSTHIYLKGTDVSDFSELSGSTAEFEVSFDALDLESRAYVETYVSAWGEEGPPGPPSASVVVGNKQHVQLSMMAGIPAGNYNITSARLYRTHSGANGTYYQFVAERPIATTIFTDEINDDQLGELIDTADFDMPPTDMQGVINLPGGVLAGFSGKNLCFSEPMQPHAWPVKYRLSADTDIVAIGAFGGSIIVTTKSNPHLVSGTHPSNMSMIKLEEIQSCVSKRGLVDMGYAVLYPSPDGLVLATDSGIKVISRQFMSKAQWKALKPESMHAYQHDGQYIAFYDIGITQGCFIFDPANTQAPYTFADVYATAGYSDPERDELYLQVGNDIVLWDGGAAITSTWRSKIFNQTAAFSAARVTASGYPVTFRLNADGYARLEHSVMDDKPFRLPPGYGDTWEVEVVSSYRIKRILIGSMIQMGAA